MRKSWRLPVSMVVTIEKSWKRESVQTNSPKKKTLEHIEQEEVAAFVVGHLSPRAKQAVVAHLADCPMCRRRVAQVVLSRRMVRDPNESCN